MAYTVGNAKTIYTCMVAILIIVTILVWRTENISFSHSTAKEHLPPIQLVKTSPLTSHPEENLNPITHIHHNPHSTNKNPNNTHFGIHTAPYDFSKVYIYGEEEYCDRNKYKNLKYMDVTGMYNTGTNTVYQILTKNCWGKRTNYRDFITAYPPDGADKAEEIKFLEQARQVYEKTKANIFRNVSTFLNVKWKPLTGKHNVISAEQDFTDPEFSEVVDGIRDRLGLVVIKDPLTWFKSLCKEPYGVKFYNRSFCYYPTKDASHFFPFGIGKNKGKYSANMWHSVKFSSVMDLWNWWYGTWTDSGETISVNWDPTYSYWMSTLKEKYGAFNGHGNWPKWMGEEFLKTDKTHVLHKVNRSRFDEELYYKAAKNIPHLVIRYEDILFQPQKLIHKLCDCVGGYMRPGKLLIQEGAAKGHGVSRSRPQALQTYGNPEYRFKGYTQEDIKWMKKRLNQTLLELFSYEF